MEKCAQKGLGKVIYESIDKLISYGLRTGLIQSEDRAYATNKIIKLLGLDSYEPTGAECKADSELPEILAELLDYAGENGIVDRESIVVCDLFDTELMDVLTPYPSTVISEFRRLYAENPRKATDYLYKLSGDSNYIRRDRVSKDVKWTVDSEYGEIEMTINCSKPEKDPKAIAAARTKKDADMKYPKCALCTENEGYAGRLDHPARQNHRIIPIEICGRHWGFQYSPYVYYNEHCIVFNGEHTPMIIDRAVFEKLLDFIRQFGHYIVGSNADLPIVGGSILTHEHFQGGNHIFPMHRAKSEKFYKISGFEDIEVSRVKWPLSVIRLKGKEPSRIVDLADIILTKWRSYTDESAYIFAETDGVPHNTITPIASKSDGDYVMDLVLRNNITTDEHPAGLYHVHAEKHHIKRENIGLIEAMGMAILPARLVPELDAVAEAILSGKDMTKDEKTASHADWAREVAAKHPEINADNVKEILLHEVGHVFTEGLEDSGVYKRNDAGFAAFDRFIESIR